MIDHQHRGGFDDDGAHAQVCRREQRIARGPGEGRYSTLHHAFPAPEGVSLAPSRRGWHAPAEALPGDGALRRRQFDVHAAPRGGTLLDARVPVLFNEALTVLVARPSCSDDAYFANLDGDELAFVCEGSGRVESSFGLLAFRAGDHVLIPRGVLHRWHLEGEGHVVAFFEARGTVDVPARYRDATGDLTAEAPYASCDFVRPAGFAWTPEQGRGGAHTVVSKRGGRFAEYTLDHHPLDVVAWEGSVYPVAVAIDGRSTRVTFEAGGFVVCAHAHGASVDEDVLVLDARGAGLSLHPAGVPRGGVIDATAVMVRTSESLRMTPNALGMESRPRG